MKPHDTFLQLAAIGDRLPAGAVRARPPRGAPRRVPGLRPPGRRLPGRRPGARAPARGDPARAPGGRHPGRGPPPGRRPPPAPAAGPRRPPGPARWWARSRWVPSSCATPRTTSRSSCPRWRRRARGRTRARGPDRPPGRLARPTVDALVDRDRVDLAGHVTVEHSAEGGTSAWPPSGRSVHAARIAAWIAGRRLCGASDSGSQGRHPGSPSSPRRTTPAPAPDGASIAVHRGTIDVGETWIVADDGERVHRLPRVRSTHWSPDGAWLAGPAAIRGLRGRRHPRRRERWRAAGSCCRLRPRLVARRRPIAYVVVDGQGAKLRVMTPFSDASDTRYTAPAGSELAAPAWLPMAPWCS